VKDPGTTLWSLAKDGGEVRCRVRLVPFGIEIDILRNGTVSVTRAFDSEKDALDWADRKRSEREAHGWKSTTTSDSSADDL
jgi:hypothetical protein